MVFFGSRKIYFAQKMTMSNLYASIVESHRLTENIGEMELHDSFTRLNTTDAGTNSTISL